MGTGARAAQAPRRDREVVDLATEDIWVMRGLRWDDPLRIRTWRELEDWVEEVGFLPLFRGDVAGFSAEEHVSPDFWWTGDREQDPWEWRELIAANHRVAYGKFFEGRAGFISREWLPVFANARRDGYDFDAAWEDARADRREKRIMDRFLSPGPEDVPLFSDEAIPSTDLKRMAGFGKGGEKNYAGIVTGLQARLYLVIAGFRRRHNRRGEEYGMPVSLLQAPEAIWGYDALTAAYGEAPIESWRRIRDHIARRYPGADAAAVARLAGRPPRD